MPEIGFSSFQLNELTFFLEVNSSVTKFFLLNETNSHGIFGHILKRGTLYSSEVATKRGSEVPASFFLPYINNSAGTGTSNLQAQQN